MADSNKAGDGEATRRPPEGPSETLRQMDPELAGRAAQFLKGLKERPPEKRKKTFWEILTGFTGDDGERAEAYRQWYLGQEPRLIEVLDRHHERHLTDVELVKNWLRMTPKRRIERAKLAFESSADRELTKLLKDWTDEIDRSALHTPSQVELDARDEREQAVQTRKETLRQRRHQAEMRRQRRPLWLRILWPF
jgi:hypothetical protein